MVDANGELAAQLATRAYELALVEDDVPSFPSGTTVWQKVRTVRKGSNEPWARLDRDSVRELVDLAGSERQVMRQASRLVVRRHERSPERERARRLLLDALLVQTRRTARRNSARVWPIFLALAALGLAVAIVYETLVPIPLILVGLAACAAAWFLRRSG